MGLWEALGAEGQAAAKGGAPTVVLIVHVSFHDANCSWRAVAATAALQREQLPRPAS